jgi:superfamily II DNA or RNA helicase
MLTPRPYQREAILLGRKALKKHQRALVVLATGLGKTLISAWIWQGFKRGKGLFLVHTNGILYGAMKEYRRVFGEKAKFAIYNHRSKDIEEADIVFATFQTMRRRLRHFPKDYFSWMTVDETHHAHALSYKPVVEYFSCPKLGITATPDRADLRDIRGLFGNEVVNVPLEEAIARGWLPKIEYHLVTDPGFDEAALQRLTREVLEDGTRLSLKELNRRIFIRARDEKVAKIIQRYDEKTIIFCRNIAHAEHFKRFLKNAESYHSGHSDEHNERVLDNLRVGITKRVLAVNSFNEGIDIPDVGLVVFYRTTDSDTIFRQQLGRGLRPTKQKLIALDFVGNIERIQRLRALALKIAELHEQFTPKRERSREGYTRSRLHLSGKGFEFTFADKLVDVLKVVDRINVDPYPTWQEAAVSARAFGMRSQSEYTRHYKKEPRLPSNPNQMYKDYTGDTIFFGTDKYSTWQEASRSAIGMGIQTAKQYQSLYRRDSHLPSNPDGLYKDFPGWRIFLGKPAETEKYKTWREAQKAAHKLGAFSWVSYQTHYKKDPKLPSNPSTHYKDWPGGRKFFASGKWKYPTWQKASRAIRRLGIRTFTEYFRRRHEDPLLPAVPHKTYKDFPGYSKFLNGR